jgi:hypothetical protein
MTTTSSGALLGGIIRSSPPEDSRLGQRGFPPLFLYAPYSSRCRLGCMGLGGCFAALLFWLQMVAIGRGGCFASVVLF